MPSQKRYPLSWCPSTYQGVTRWGRAEVIRDIARREVYICGIDYVTHDNRSGESCSTKGGSVPLRCRARTQLRVRDVE